MTVMITRRRMTLASAAALTSWAAERKTSGAISIYRVPQGGLQPQIVMDERGTMHLIYYVGDPRQGNVFYAQSHDGGSKFSRALQVNSQFGSAIAMGTIRGAQLAIGNAGRAHVAWNGSGQAEPSGPLNPDSGTHGMPMLYARLNDRGDAFEVQRNVMRHSFGLDGGGSVAADQSGNVFVAWHGIGESEASRNGREGEARRRVWITKSQDQGHSFSTEMAAWSQVTGACGCCGMKVFAARRGNVFALYRSATESVHRDIYLLVSNDYGKSFHGSLLHKWDINACPMSSMDLAENDKIVIGAWETGGQVFWSRIDPIGGAVDQPIPAPGEGKGRKHPRVAVNQNGDVLLAWTEGTGWQKGGTLAYQVYDHTGKPATDKAQLSGIPAWSFAAVAARANNSFSILY